MGVFDNIALPIQNLKEIGIVNITDQSRNVNTAANTNQNNNFAEESQSSQTECRIFLAEAIQGPLPFKKRGLELEWFEFPEEIPYSEMDPDAQYWLKHAITGKEFICDILKDQNGIQKKWKVQLGNTLAYARNPASSGD
jgi:hypothetical protein